jgi:GntR family transcriptional regulator
MMGLDEDERSRDGLDLGPGMARRSVDYRDGLPLYQRIRKALQDELARGTWKPGQMLPTELELSERFGVSPGTIKQAMLGLVRDGLIVRRSGKGTFVARLDDSRSLAGFFSFREGRTGEELHPAIRVIDLRVLDKAPAEARKHLKLGPRGRVLFARRLLVQDGTPICIYDSFLPYQMVAGLENERLEVDPLYHAIEKRFDIHVVSVEEMLRAEIVAGEEAALLNVPAGSPVIHVERVAFTHNKAVVEWRRTIGRSDHFIYKIKLP